MNRGENIITFGAQYLFVLLRCTCVARPYYARVRFGLEGPRLYPGIVLTSYGCRRRRRKHSSPPPYLFLCFNSFFLFYSFSVRGVRDARLRFAVCDRGYLENPGVCRQPSTSIEMGKNRNFSVRVSIVWALTVEFFSFFLENHSRKREDSLIYSSGFFLRINVEINKISLCTK